MCFFQKGLAKSGKEWYDIVGLILMQIFEEVQVMELGRDLPVQPDDCLVVILLGIGIVFLGLVCLIFVCKLMGALVGKAVKREKPQAAVAAPAPAAAPAVVADRGELAAAISAALAEELGRDVTDLRILSITKR